MSTLSSLQPLDYLLLLLWVLPVGWGLLSGAIRQAGVLVAVIIGMIAARGFYQPLGGAITLIVGENQRPAAEFGSYVFLFLLGAIGLGAVIWRTYPSTRLSVGLVVDRLLGAIVAAIWGILLVVMVLVVLRFFTVTFWPSMQPTQQQVGEELTSAHALPTVRARLGPMLHVVSPAFPTAVRPDLSASPAA